MDRQYYLEMYINLYKDSVLKNCKNYNNIRPEHMSEKRIQQYLSGKSPKLTKNALTIYKCINNENHILYKYYCGYSYDEIQNDYNNRKKEKRNKLKVFKQFWLDEGYSEYYAELLSKENYYNGKNHKLPVSQVDKKYWIYRGYTEEDAVKKISQLQKENSYKWNSQNKTERFKNSQTTHINYWLNKGYNEEEAKIKLSERQSTFSLKKCIEKYGEDEGRKIFKERQKKWQKTLKDKYCSTKEDEILYNIKKSSIYKNILLHNNNDSIKSLNDYKILNFTSLLKKILQKKKFNTGSYASNEAIEFFKIFINPIFDEYNYSYITALHKYNKTEKHILDNNTIYFYDFCCEDLNIIIEYNGTKFHPKSLDDKNFNHPYKKSSEEVYNHDKIKKEVAINHGYVNYFSIWSDYTDKELNQLIESINEIIKNHN